MNSKRMNEANRMIERFEDAARDAADRLDYLTANGGSAREIERARAEYQQRRDEWSPAFSAWTRIESEEGWDLQD